MNLVIHAHTLKNEPLSLPITGRFDVRGGTIGRSDTNTLSLPDPERHISRLHAEVWFSNGSFSIRNVGSANPIMLNGRAIVPGEGATLAEADEIVIGTYVMRVSLDQPQAAPKEVDSRTVITLAPAPAPAGSKPFAPLPASATPVEAAARPAAPPPGHDIFADLLPPATPGGAAAPAASDPFADLFRPTPPAAPAPATPPAPGRLPDDFDPFAPQARPAAEPSAQGKGTVPAGLDAFMAPPPAPKKPTPAQVAAFTDLLGEPATPKGSLLDDAFGLGNPPASGEDPLAGFFGSPAKGDAGVSPASSKDPLALFGGTPDEPAFPGSASLHDHDRTPALKGAFTPPPVPSAPPAPEPEPEEPAATPSKPWYARFSTSTAAPVPPAKPAPVEPEAAPPTAPPPERPPRGIMLSSHLIPDTTMPAVRVSREVPFTFEAPNKPMPPIPQADGSLVPPPPPAPIRIPPLQAPSPAAPAAAAAPVAPVAPAPAVPTQPASAEALWAAFCEGAGISVQVPQGLNPDLMRVIGQVLHHSVEGTLKLVAVRAAAKQELRAQVTTIQSRNNNPLKFSPDAATAIEQLLQPPARGFMVGPAAVNDAMDDLLGHAIGTMAGMRAALSGVLQRFEPARLEGKLSGQSVIDSLLPMNRRAKLWELYLQHYERIQGDAEEDFHELFGKAFMRAYDDQLNRLDNDRRSPPQT